MRKLLQQSNVIATHDFDFSPARSLQHETCPICSRSALCTCNMIADSRIAVLYLRSISSFDGSYDFLCSTAGDMTRSEFNKITDLSAKSSATVPVVQTGVSAQSTARQPVRLRVMRATDLGLDRCFRLFMCSFPSGQHTIRRYMDLWCVTGDLLRVLGRVIRKGLSPGLSIRDTCIPWTDDTDAPGSEDSLRFRPRRFVHSPALSFQADNSKPRSHHVHRVLCRSLDRPIQICWQAECSMSSWPLGCWHTGSVAQSMPILLPPPTAILVMLDILGLASIEPVWSVHRAFGLQWHFAFRCECGQFLSIHTRDFSTVLWCPYTYLGGVPGLWCSALGSDMSRRDGRVYSSTNPELPAPDDHRPPLPRRRPVRTTSPTVVADAGPVRPRSPLARRRALPRRRSIGDSNPTGCRFRSHSQATRRCTC